MTTRVSPQRTAAIASRSPAGPVGAGKSVVNMDVFKGDTEGSEAFPLCAEVLAVGGNARVSDFQCSH